MDAANKKRYPCTFSNGWFEGFCERWSISWRVKTKVGQDAPDDKAKAIQTFLQEIRRKSQPPARSQQHNRFLPQYIYNMDQTPLPFEFLQNCTFDTKGTTTVFIHTEHTSWTKRQATLMITACADGELRCKPILVFHGSSTVEQQPRKEERKKYHPGVTVFFNSTAYSNEEITMK